MGQRGFQQFDFRGILSKPESTPTMLLHSCLKRTQAPGFD
jgi:hypothetical protein